MTTETLRVGKRALAVTVALATMAWAIGLATMIAPLSASAVTLTSGSLIRGTTFTTVYYYAANGKRCVFPNEKTYKSWYSDFSSVQKISDADLTSIPMGCGNVTYKPGSQLLKIQSDIVPAANAPKMPAMTTPSAPFWKTGGLSSRCCASVR